MQLRVAIATAVVLLGPVLAGCGDGAQEPLSVTRLPHLRAPLDTLGTRVWSDTLQPGTDLEPLSEGAAALWEAAPPNRRLPPADQLVYTTYENAAFGYRLIYPDTLLKPVGEVGGNRGQEFASSNGAVRLIVYASEGSREELVQQYMDEMDHPELEVTYHVLGDDWYAIAGFQGEWKVYEKTLLGKGTLTTFRIQYETEHADYYDAVAATIATNFTP